jgi:hypothetical protein
VQELLTFSHFISSSGWEESYAFLSLSIERFLKRRVMFLERTGDRGTGGAAPPKIKNADEKRRFGKILSRGGNRANRANLKETRGI